MSPSISLSENLSKLLLICRLCGNASNSYMKIFGPEGLKCTLNNKILSYLKLEVTDTDLLPKVICYSCLQKLEEFDKFFKWTHTVEENLKSTVNKSLSTVKIKIDLSEDETYNDNKISLRKNHQLSFPEVQLKNRIGINSDESLSFHDENEDVNKRKMKLSSPINNIYDKSCIGRDYQKPSNLKNNEDVKYTDKINHFQQFNSTRNQNKLSLRENNTAILKQSNLNIYENSVALDDISTLEIINDQNLSVESAKIIVKIPISCIICNEQVMGPKKLTEHYYQQHPNTTLAFKCTICEYVLENWKKFFIHYQKHKDINKYVCNICGKSFHKSWSLKVHATVHTDCKPYHCDKCSKSFKNQSSLKIHKIVHLPDECKLIYACTYCNKSFRSKFILKAHQKIHTGQKDFICDYCGKSFMNKRSLLSHITIHNYVQPVKCFLCEKLLKTEKLLNKHLESHSIKKQFKCEYCGKEYRYDTQFNEHKRLHTGELPYKCEHCNKCFRLNSSLTIHKRQHTGVKPYKCNVCERLFTNWSNYNKHMKRKHYNTIIKERNNELILLKI